MDEWETVDKYAERAKAIAFDECHKIYIATDKHEADYFSEGGFEVFTGEVVDIMEKLREWYFVQACGLRFITAVRFDKKKGETVFKTLIPQR